jgi:hypothetical protein
VTGDRLDVISSGPDPDRPVRRPGRWRLTAAAGVLLIGGGSAAGVLLAGQSAGSRAGRPSVAHARGVRAMLHGAPPGPGLVPGTELLLAGTGMRLLRAGAATARLGWADRLLGAASPLGSNPAVRYLQAVAGGFVALLAGETGCCRPAVGEVFFIPVTSRGTAAPRLIAHASYLAVTPNGRDIWAQWASPPGDTWRTDRSGQRLSPMLRLPGQILLAATGRGLITGSARGRRVRLVSTASGAALSTPVPSGALIAAIGTGQLAWQSSPCARLSCPLHITSLRTGTDTTIALPKGTQTNGQPGAFDQADKRLALALDTIGRKHHPAATHIYVIDIGTHHISRLPGGPLPLTQAASDRGAIAAGLSGFNTVTWPGPDLWILASDSTAFQAAYWPGTGPLHVLPAQPGQIFNFAAATPPSR